MKKFALLVLVLIEAGCAAQGKLYWRAKDFVLDRSPMVQLRGPDEQVVLTIPIGGDPVAGKVSQNESRLRFAIFVHASSNEERMQNLKALIEARTGERSLSILPTR